MKVALGSRGAGACTPALALCFTAVVVPLHPLRLRAMSVHGLHFQVRHGTVRGVMHLLLPNLDMIFVWRSGIPRWRGILARNAGPDL